MNPDVVYKDLIISTIVDIKINTLAARVYKDLIISTIVDKKYLMSVIFRVYKDLIISTIVDSLLACRPDGGL